MIRGYGVVTQWIRKTGEPFDVMDQTVQAACQIVEESELVRIHIDETGEIFKSARDLLWADSNKLIMFDKIFADVSPEDIRKKRWEKILTPKEGATKSDELLAEMVLYLFKIYDENEEKYAVKRRPGFIEKLDDEDEEFAC